MSEGRRFGLKPSGRVSHDPDVGRLKDESGTPEGSAGPRVGYRESWFRLNTFRIGSAKSGSRVLDPEAAGCIRVTPRPDMGLSVLLPVLPKGARTGSE